MCDNEKLVLGTRKKIKVEKNVNEITKRIFMSNQKQKIVYEFEVFFVVRENFTFFVTHC
jgi:hypothetical protein